GTLPTASSASASIAASECAQTRWYRPTSCSRARARLGCGEGGAAVCPGARGSLGSAGAALGLLRLATASEVLERVDGCLIQGHGAALIPQRGKRGRLERPLYR